MNFIKLKRNYRAYSYCQTEMNNTLLGFLSCFLADDAYTKSDDFLDWLCTLNNEITSSGGNSTTVLFDKKKIIMMADCDSIDYDENGENEDISTFEITKLDLIDVLCQWKNIIGEDPLKNEKEGKEPENIVIIQDKNNKIKIEVIGSQDIRFSRFIKDKNQPWVKLIKSDIFDNYFKVESNNELLYKLGLFLSRYELQKESLENWIDLNDKDNPMIFIGNLTAVYRTKDMFSIGYNGLELSKDKFIDLGHQWEDLIKNSDLTEVEVQYENNEVNLIPQY